MTASRRRVIRPTDPARTTTPARLPRLRSQLEREQRVCIRKLDDLSFRC
jgi:hypothetical protein